MKKVAKVKDILDVKELTFLLTYSDGEERCECTCKPTDVKIDKNRYGDGIDWLLFDTDDSSCAIQILNKEREINHEQEACGEYDLTVYL